MVTTVGGFGFGFEQDSELELTHVDRYEIIKPIGTGGMGTVYKAIDRQRDRGGRVIAFLFSGKGWGHGVGMCQVGAYGLAKGGATFEQILHHYYTGITIERIGIDASSRGPVD